MAKQPHGFESPIGFLVLKPDQPFPFIEISGKKYLVMMDRGGTTFHERFVADLDNNKTYLHVKLADDLPIPSTKLGLFSSRLSEDLQASTEADPPVLPLSMSTQRHVENR